MPCFPGQLGEVAVVVGDEMADGLAEIGEEGVRGLAVIDDVACQHRQPWEEVVAVMFAGTSRSKPGRPVHAAALPTVGVDVAQRGPGERADGLASAVRRSCSSNSSSAAGLRRSITRPPQPALCVETCAPAEMWPMRRTSHRPAGASHPRLPSVPIFACQIDDVGAFHMDFIRVSRPAFPTRTGHRGRHAECAGGVFRGRDP